jgi:predicted nucleic acid-binding protein
VARSDGRKRLSSGLLGEFITYETQNIKFADAVMGYWGLEEGLAKVYTYDESDFKKIRGLRVLRP